MSNATYRYAPRVGRAAEYTTWQNMIARCSNPSHPKYPAYGARGITVCDRWRQSWAFIADMGERPSPEHSIDRIDNDGNYEPGNCRWATRSEQQQNRRPVGPLSETHKANISATKRAQAIRPPLTPTERSRAFRARRRTAAHV